MRQAKNIKPLAKWTLLIIAFVIALWIVINLLGIAFISSTTIMDYFPEEGQWYCEELQLMVPFDSSLECYIIKNGEKIICGCGNDRGSSWLSVCCQDEDQEYYVLGEEVFGGEFVKLEENILIIFEPQSGREYTFICAPNSRLPLGIK